MADRKLNSLALAEAKANDIVKRAVERKSKLLGDASGAAEKEIATVKERYQKEFEAKKYDITEEEKKQEEITKVEIQEVYKHYNSNADDVVEFMLKNITRVDLKVFRNIVADFSGL